MTDAISKLRAAAPRLSREQLVQVAENWIAAPGDISELARSYLALLSVVEAAERWRDAPDAFEAHGHLKDMVAAIDSMRGAVR